MRGGWVDWRPNPGRFADIGMSSPLLMPLAEP